MMAFILGAIVASFIHATHSYEECKAVDFEPDACITSKVTDKIGK